MFRQAQRCCQLYSGPQKQSSSQSEHNHTVCFPTLLLLSEVRAPVGCFLIKLWIFSKTRRVRFKKINRKSSNSITPRVRSSRCLSGSSDEERLSKVSLCYRLCVPHSAHTPLILKWLAQDSVQLAAFAFTKVTQASPPSLPLFWCSFTSLKLARGHRDKELCIPHFSSLVFISGCRYLFFPSILFSLLKVWLLSFP